MSYICNRPYPEVYEFSIDKLECPAPPDIYHRMVWKVYGTDDPLPDDNPAKGCSISLKCYGNPILGRNLIQQHKC
eukprot:13616064-Ditylum_brightwellii.AAC.1